MYSPIDLEIKINKFEHFIVSLLNRKISLLVFAFLLFLIFNYFTFSYWSYPAYPSWTRINLIQDKYWSSLIVLFGSLIVYFLNGKVKSTFLVMIVSLSWIFSLSKLNTSILANLYPIFFIGLVSLILMRFNFSRIINFLIITLLYLLLIYGQAKTAFVTNDAKAFQFFSTLHTEYLYLYLIQLIILKSKNINLLWNPLQLFSPIPLPSTTSEVKTNKKELFLSGFVEIVKSNLLMFLCFYVFKNIKIENLFLDSFLKYFSFIFLITAAMSFLTGTLRIYGFNVISASYFLILAKSPLETWQRGSVYLAKFTFDFIFFPLWKKNRSYIIPSAFVITFIFFNLFLFHDYLLKLVVLVCFPNFLTSIPPLSSLYLQLLWLALWGVWILAFNLLFLRAPALRNSKVGQWLLVFLTHLGNASLIPLSYFLLTYLHVLK